MSGHKEDATQGDRSTGGAFLKSMRPRQWAKNILVFVPLLTSHGYGDPNAVLTAVAAFVWLSICASGGYFINDLLDLEADRQHQQKRYRPLASGTLPRSVGIVGAVTLPLVALAMAWLTMPTMFTLVLVVYLVTSIAYSYFLKQVTIADVMTLAVLYTLRIIAGSTAEDIELSSWLMAFSVFFFVSLAYLKRYVEVAALPVENGRVLGRGYFSTDKETIFVLGIANISTAVLVLALYVNSEIVSSLYRTPQVLWLLCLLMLFWSSHIWMRARRGEITDDPVVFATKDGISLMTGLALVGVVLIARFLG